MATDRLDTEDLLRESTASGWKAMPAKTEIGHVHLHVRNLAKAMKFYREILGLNLTATYSGAYFFGQVNIITILQRIFGLEPTFSQLHQNMLD